MLNYYFGNLFFVHAAELLAAMAGSYYLTKKPNTQIAVKMFVYFLWITFFVEIIGLYATYAYLTNYKDLGFLKDSPFKSNHWLYNIYGVLSYLIYFLFFALHLRRKKFRKIILSLTVFFAVTGTINLILSDSFFNAFSAYSHITGTIIMILCISAYYYELLTSERILYFYKNVAFYISIGALIFHVVSTPLFIYSKYFTRQSPEFILVYEVVLKSANFFLYGIIMLGFIWCSGRIQRVLKPERM